MSGSAQKGLTYNSVNVTPALLSGNVQKGQQYPTVDKANDILYSSAHDGLSNSAVNVANALMSSSASIPSEITDEQDDEFIEELHIVDELYFAQIESSQSENLSDDDGVGGNSSNSVIKTETTDEKDHGKQMNTCTSGNVRPGTCTTGNFPPGIYPAKNFPSGTCIHQAKKNPGQLNKQNTIKHQNYNVMRQLLAWGSNNRMRGKYKPDDINDMLHDSSNRTDKQSLIVTTLADVVNVKPLIVIDPGKDYDYNCIECGKILNPPFHQCLWQCKKCSFASVCMISFKAHYNRRHNGTLGPLNKVNQPCIQDMSVDNNLLLCTCGKCKSFHSCNPKEMCMYIPCHLYANMAAVNPISGIKCP
ncbi:Hypothetical predicted protein [Mytilus galloprovincialis]|uniref:POGZ/Z280C-D-like double Zinc finger domain-containing protein n=1 Tax=Mytilus galloprovincialis TaxID=29158 RepID=A0A8B6EJ72_MYTGA|nr:Hypothetical predicted protein [Mytilus galloprovincialis]